MRVRNLGALLAALLLALPAAAQETRGAIEGLVKDAQAAGIPGATIEATSDGGLSISAVTDTTGHYRFPSLPPGRYTVAATMPGFSSAKVQDVRLALGQLLSVDLALTVGGVTETLVVTVEAPLIDVKQSARFSNLREESLTKVPRGRDFTTIATQAPGVNNENTKLGGLSIDGASAGENRFIVDGAETTNLRSGISGKVLVTDFVEEVQVKSSGYTAEYGGATGGVINALTKGGTNTWRGSAFTYFSGDVLDSDPGSRLRLVPTNSNAAEYVTYPKDSYQNWEPGFTLGGPLVKDQVWFFAGYNPSFQRLERPVTFLADNQERTTRQDFTRHNLTANLTAQLGAKTRARAAFTSSGFKQEGRLAGLDGSSSPTANFAINDVNSNYSGSLSLDYAPFNKLFVSARGGFYRDNTHNENVYDGTRYIFLTSNVGQAGVPAEFQRAVGTSNVPTNTSTTRDIKARMSGQLDATYYMSLGGDHQWKAGIQFDRIANDVLTGEQGNRVNLFWDRQLVSSDPTSRGTYGYYTLRSNGVDPQRGFTTAGDIQTDNLGLFLQDSWTINNRLTINLGIRTENEHVPNFADASYGLPDTAISFSFKDKLAPRAGFAYDIKGDGKWKVYGSWGIFYDVIKLELPRGSFGGDKWLEYYYTLDTADWTTLDTANCPPQCPGRLIRGPIDFRHPSLGEDTLDPNIKPFKQQEAVVGFDHELSNMLSASVRYVHKQFDRVIEDTGALDAQQNEIYVIGNPSEGMLATAFVLADGTQIAMPKPKRQYDAVEVSLNKRMSNRWSGRLSYLWSRLYGNHTGLSQGDENGRTSPNVGRTYDYPIMMFDGSGQPAYGLLPTDRTHQIKGQFVYDFPFGTSVGLNGYAASGVPRTREVTVIPPNNFPVPVNGRNSDGRMPFFSQLDLYAQHELKLAGRMRLTLGANVLNLLNQKTAVNYYQYQLAAGQGVNFTEQAFYTGQVDISGIIASQNIPQDPRFLKDGFCSTANDQIGAQDCGYQNSRQMRFSLALSF